MKWNDLSMTERAAYIRAGVNSGLTNLNDIHRAYHTYAKGGYLDWIDKVKEWRPGISEDIDAEEPTYDYEGFFMEDPDRAWRMLKGDPEVHFIDEYKKHRYDGGGPLEGFTIVDVTSPVPVYTEDETGNMYYISNGKMTGISSFEEGRNLYNSELENIRNEKLKNQRINNSTNSYRERLEETERLKQESAIRQKNALERAETAKQHHNHSYLASKSNDTIVKEENRNKEINRSKELIQNSLEQASKPTFESQAIAQAINNHEKERKEKLHLSLNTMNAGATVASLFVPEFNVLNTILGGAGVYQDIKEDNPIQTTLGLFGIAAPLLREWNPKWYRTRTSTVDGRTTSRFDDIELGNALYGTSTSAGLSGDIYGAIVDDKIFSK